MTQTDRLVQFLRTHPLATGMEIITALALPKYTSRISDARAQGYVIDCEMRSDGRKGYVLRDPTPGVAHITATDSKAQVDRKMAEAFAPVTSALEAWQRVFGGDG